MLAIRASQFSTLEKYTRRQLALFVLAELRTSTPHAVNGLTPSEIDFRLDTAVAKTEAHELDVRDDIEAFVRLSLLVGPLFDEYPPFKEILSGFDNDTRILALFTYATASDWSNASQFDVVSRYRKTTPDAGTITLTPLTDLHVDDYFQHALHPDVWRLAQMEPMPQADEVRQLFEDNRLANKTGYAIVNQQDQFLGAIFAADSETPARISYWIARHRWGKGIASQALAQLKNMQPTRKWLINVEPGNTPSLKVATKCGFSQTDAVTLES